MPRIEPQNPTDAPAIEALLDLAFGHGRHARPSYRLREGIAPIETLGLVAREDGALVGTLRFWPVSVGDRDDAPALLLGPLAIHPDRRGQGIARGLVGRGLERAAKAGYRVVVTVGEPGLFARFGFAQARAAGLSMPVPVDEARFLAAELVPGALAQTTGVLGRWRGGMGATAKNGAACGLIPVSR